MKKEDVTGIAPPNQTYGVHGPEALVHLYRNMSHEESEVWCGQESTWRQGATWNPSEAACCECLRQAAKYGQAAELRRVHLLFRYVPDAADSEQHDEESVG